MDTVIDVNLNQNDEEIRLKPVSYTMPNLCEELGEAYSTVRYWITQFGDYLDCDVDQRNKKFSSRDLELFKFIKKMLKEDKFTTKQVQEYLKNNIENFDNRIVVENPATESMLVQKIIKSEIQSVKEEMVTEITTAVTKQIASVLLQIQQQNFDEMKNELAATMKNNIESTLEKELTSKIEQIEVKLDKIDKMEIALTERDADVTKCLRENIELRKKELELKEKEGNKGFFQKLFNRG